MKWHWTCRKCGGRNHISGDDCVHCELADGWDSAAAVHERAAAECRQMAAQIREEYAARDAKKVEARTATR